MKKLLFLLSAALFIASCSDDEIAQPYLPSGDNIDCSSPRFMTTHGNKVYASYQSGEVVRIDTTTLKFEAAVKVGRSPEQLCVSEGKLYVANSGGADYPNYDNTVSVVNISDFVEDCKITVVDNPSNILASNEGTLYLVSYGNYADVPAALQKINPSTNDVANLAPVNMSEMCYADGLLYGILSEYDASWNQTISYKLYNTQTGELEPSWITDGSSVANPYKLCIVGDNIALTDAPYVANGDVYLFTKDGKKSTSIPAGLYPVKVVKAGKYIYVLNSGVMGQNNASLTCYDTESGAVVQNYFKTVNNYAIGDTANDIIVYGQKMYITVTGDNIIWVTDLNARVLAKLEP